MRWCFIHQDPFTLTEACKKYHKVSTTTSQMSTFWYIFFPLQCPIMFFFIMEFILAYFFLSWLSSTLIFTFFFQLLISKLENNKPMKAEDKAKVMETLSTLTKSISKLQEDIKGISASASLRVVKSKAQVCHDNTEIYIYEVYGDVFMCQGTKGAAWCGVGFV